MENLVIHDLVCPNCMEKGISIFHTIKNVPVHSVFNIPTKSEAMNFPKGSLSLGFCKKCGFIFNADFDPKVLMYSVNCEESQGCSQIFHEFLYNLAARLVEKYDLRQKKILEIGCGKGEFLELLCKIGNNTGIGFDPAYREGRIDENSVGIRIIRDYYSEKYTNISSDMICCRMTLEHIHDPYDFLSMIRRSIGERYETIVFFQVPDVIRILRDCAFEDIYYEHCSYFSADSLFNLFQKTGFEILSLTDGYDGQYLLLEAQPTKKGGIHAKPFPYHPKTEGMMRLVEGFAKKHERKRTLWHDIFAEFQTQGLKVVLWGAGSKAVAFLMTLKLSHTIHYVVDINPFRHGYFMAGTGQQIVAPEALKEYRPDAVVIMNSIYKDEIKEYLSNMELSPMLIPLGDKILKLNASITSIKAGGCFD